MMSNWWQTLKELCRKTEPEASSNALCDCLLLADRVAELEAAVRLQGEMLAPLTRPPEIDWDAVLQGIDASGSIYTVHVGPGEPEVPEPENGPAPERHKPLDPERPRFTTDAKSIIGACAKVSPDAVDEGDGIRFRAPTNDAFAKQPEGQ